MLSTGDHISNFFSYIYGLGFMRGLRFFICWDILGHGVTGIPPDMCNVWIPRKGGVMTPLQAALEAGKLTEEERDDNIEVGSKGTVTVDAVGLSEDAHTKLASHLAWWIVDDLRRQAEHWDGGTKGMAGGVALRQAAGALKAHLQSLGIEKPTEASYEAARGAVPWVEGMPLPEDAIGRGREAP